MNFRVKLLGIVSLLLLFTAVNFAQEKMTEEQWESEMATYKDKKVALENEIAALKSDIDNLKAMDLQDPEECIDELYQIVGATRNDVNNYRKAVNELDGKIKRKEGPKTDRQTDLNTLKMNKISALPEFYNKVHNQMQKDLDNWVEAPTDISYSVVKGDCLWNIAKKKEHYGNGFAWPVIYQANRDQIKNPDLIFPNQTFKIPNLTEEEKSKYEKLRVNYKPAPVQ
ncbi:MAG: LysM peptidoglycan-binding domain-containing protein [Ignavibacteriales bacterium]|nr:LysM peptidoglycan-binding domain-containing protein [Ignavibacteriales bacterium]MBP9120513.1 LysM peptidoglycan-binding domain-containing protein [Ignavibacterium sp.]